MMKRESLEDHRERMAERRERYHRRKVTIPHVDRSIYTGAVLKVLPALNASGRQLAISRLPDGKRRDRLVRSLA